MRIVLPVYLWIVSHLPLLGFMVAAVNIVVTLANWNISKPKVEIYKTTVETIFKKSFPAEYGYVDSHCIVFSYVQVANLSSNPCTFSQFELCVPGYESCFFRSGTHVCEQYLIKKDGKSSDIISSDAVLKMPCTIPPYGYAEGVLLFPFAPEYFGDKLRGKIVARTAKKNFDFYVELSRIL